MVQNATLKYLPKLHLRLVLGQSLLENLSETLG